MVRRRARLENPPRPKAGGITVATLFKQARDNGYRPDKPAVALTPEQSEQRALETATKNKIFHPISIPRSLCYNSL